MTFTTLCWLSFLAISEPIRSGAVQKRVRLKSHQLMVCIKEGQASLVGVSSDVTFGVIQLFSRSAWEMRSITTVDWACLYAHVTWSYGHFHSHMHGYNGCKYDFFLGGWFYCINISGLGSFKCFSGFNPDFGFLPLKWLLDIFFRWVAQPPVTEGGTASGCMTRGLLTCRKRELSVRNACTVSNTPCGE